MEIMTAHPARRLPAASSAKIDPVSRKIDPDSRPIFRMAGKCLHIVEMPRALRVRRPKYRFKATRPSPFNLISDTWSTV
ncbi:hypothetical protein J2S43_000755 [Catenuloplanes nepalensis]|uniref:Uncharacterized protein n=1 Tax=Catenuloplanes nepalensis TaxID=587533 RepID=A0ABT9MLT4_9ACTN|nr:hypothetical protein [Catenuloplanes nepalensis]MDP9792243.1 hypothetical protein [Catenuloplanes nepalensis]